MLNVQIVISLPSVTLLLTPNSLGQAKERTNTLYVYEIGMLVVASRCLLYIS